MASAPQQMLETIFQYVVYLHPADFPQHVAVRMWEISRGQIRQGQVACLYDTIEEAREEMSEHGFIRLPRNRQDDPNIVEVWMS